MKALSVLAFLLTTAIGLRAADAPRTFEQKRRALIGEIEAAQVIIARGETQPCLCVLRQPWLQTVVA